MKLKQSVVLLKLLVLSFVFVASGCGTSERGGVASGPDKAQPEAGMSYVPKVESTPSGFERFALVANGNLEIGGEFVTDGPLSDVHSNSSVSLKSAKARFTGNITAGSNIQTGSHRASVAAGNTMVNNGENVAVARAAVDEVLADNELYNAIVFLADGNVKVITDGVPVIKPPAQVAQMAGSWRYDAESGGWSVSGSSFSAEPAIVVEGNLSVNTEKFTIRAPLLVKGDLKASGVVTVDIGNPFEDALVVDGGIDVQNLNIVGKAKIGGDAVVSGALDVTGSIAASGNVTLGGKTRLTYLDTVYKAALFAAQQKFGETLLVHSQVFRGLADGRNSVALFTFVKGYKQLDEETLLRKIRDNTLNTNDYYSVVLGASADYGSTLVEFDGLAPYYANKINVLDKLSEMGHADAYITEALSVGAENFYLTFSDGNGWTGTYLIYGNSTGGTEKNGLIELTEADKESVVKKIKEIETAASKAQNVSTANKARAAASGGDVSDGKSAEEYRTDEWRYLKGLEEVSEEVEVEVESEPARSVKYYGRNQSMERGFFKKLKKAIKRIITVPSCESSTDLDFIEGVNEGGSDDWTKYVSVRSSTDNSCAVASATMILRYHGRRMGIKTFYSNDTKESNTWERDNPTKFNKDGEANIPLFNDLYTSMSTENWQLIDFGIDGDHEDMNGTALWNAADGINTVMRNAGVRGKAEWLWKDTQFNWLNLLGLDTDLFDVFQEHVRANMPPIVATNLLSGWPGQHAMPVIGTKKTRYNIWCLRLNEHYLYVHSTWELNDKRYYRFDARAYPLAIWSGLTVTVNR